MKFLLRSMLFCISFSFLHADLRVVDEVDADSSFVISDAQRDLYPRLFELSGTSGSIEMPPSLYNVMKALVQDGIAVPTLQSRIRTGSFVLDDIADVGESVAGAHNLQLDTAADLLAVSNAYVDFLAQKQSFEPRDIQDILDLFRDARILLFGTIQQRLDGYAAEALLTTLVTQGGLYNREKGRSDSFLQTLSEESTESAYIIWSRQRSAFVEDIQKEVRILPIKVQELLLKEYHDRYGVSPDIGEMITVSVYQRGVGGSQSLTLREYLNLEQAFGRNYKVNEKLTSLFTKRIVADRTIFEPNPNILPPELIEELPLLKRIASIAAQTSQTLGEAFAEYLETEVDIDRLATQDLFLKVFNMQPSYDTARWLLSQEPIRTMLMSRRNLEWSSEPLSKLLYEVTLRAKEIGVEKVRELFTNDVYADLFITVHDYLTERDWAERDTPDAREDLFKALLDFDEYFEITKPEESVLERLRLKLQEKGVSLDLNPRTVRLRSSLVERVVLISEVMASGSQYLVDNIASQRTGRSGAEQGEPFAINVEANELLVLKTLLTLAHQAGSDVQMRRLIVEDMGAFPEQYDPTDDAGWRERASSWFRTRFDQSWHSVKVKAIEWMPTIVQAAGAVGMGSSLRSGNLRGFIGSSLITFVGPRTVYMINRLAIRMRQTPQQVIDWADVASKYQFEGDVVRLVGTLYINNMESSLDQFKAEGVLGRVQISTEFSSFKTEVIREIARAYYNKKLSRVQDPIDFVHEDALLDLSLLDIDYGLSIKELSKRRTQARSEGEGDDPMKKLDSFQKLYEENGQFGRTLDFSRSLISRLDGLESVELASKKTSSLYTDVSIKTIERLRLSQNLVADLPEDAFEGYIQLKRLDLDRNKIKKIDSDFVDALPSSLEVLDLSFNSVRELTPTVLRLLKVRAPGLRTINLSQNEFSEGALFDLRSEAETLGITLNGAQVENQKKVGLFDAFLRALSDMFNKLVERVARPSRVRNAEDTIRTRAQEIRDVMEQRTDTLQSIIDSLNSRNRIS